MTETLLAHTIPGRGGGIVTPVLAVGALFVFDWRMGLCLLDSYGHRFVAFDEHDDRHQYEIL